MIKQFKFYFHLIRRKIILTFDCYKKGHRWIGSRGWGERKINHIVSYCSRCHKIRK